MGFKKNYFSPLIGLKYLFKKPETIKVPKVYREAAERYRGFHTNDWDVCIGCGTCSEICPTNAIIMTEVKELPDVEGSKPERPVIDYGRCSFCGLCVDICTTGSLKMTREYTHISPDANDFLYIPYEDGIHKVEFPEGYKRTDDSDLLDLERNNLEAMEPEGRKGSFIEFMKGFSKEQAIIESSRCVECGICTKTCPAHMDIPQYIKSVWEDNLEEATDWLYNTNPLPGVCGRVCTHKCETVCALTNRGEAIAIRWLKRYIVDNTPDDTYEKVVMAKVSKQGEGKIAIIGAGPAGLAAAYYLRTLGYEVTVFEKDARAGGVMRYGIPAYRLPDSALDRDIKFIESIGVKIKTNTEVGKDIKFEDLEKDYDAVFIGTGFTLGRSTRVPGTDHKDVYQALPLLAKIRDYVRGDGPMPYFTENVVVIGGGNVAMDIARSLVRLQNEKFGKSNVILTCLESEDIMPADREEIDESREEGVKIYPAWGPKEIEIGEDGKIKGLHVVKCLSVFDENKRFNPKFDENQKNFFEADMIVEAIGQAPNYNYIPEKYQEKLEFIRGRIKTDENGRTAIEWLFAGGDIVHGPDIIHGIADGHNAAKAIDQYLMEKNGKK